MTEPFSKIVGAIFGDAETPDCPACSGLGLVCLGISEELRLCNECGGSGFGSVLALDLADDHLDVADELAAEFDEDYPPGSVFVACGLMRETAMAECAAEFGRALLDGLDELERRLS